MFGIGQTELVLIILFAFLLFGPDKLPQMGRTIGRALRQFRETQEKMTAVVQSEIVDPMTQAASAPGSQASKKAAGDDADADREDGAETAPARKETFAERRARLAAEKAAAEAQAAGGGNASEAAPAAAPAAVPESAAAPAADAAPAVAPEPEAEPEAKPITTADLYARRPKKRATESAATEADKSAAGADAAVGADAAANTDAATQGEGEAE